MFSLMRWLRGIVLTLLHFPEFSLIPPIYLQILVRYWSKWQLCRVISSHEGMHESLQRSETSRRIYLQNLLDKINELENFEPFWYAILGVTLLPQLLNMPLFQKLSEIQKRVVSLRRFIIRMLLRGHRCLHKLLEILVYEPLLILVKHKKSVTIYAIKDHMIRWKSTKF